MDRLKTVNFLTLKNDITLTINEWNLNPWQG